jgi:hypothetical protein
MTTEIEVQPLISATRFAVAAHCSLVEQTLTDGLEREGVTPDMLENAEHAAALYCRCLRIATEQPAKTDVLARLLAGLLKDSATDFAHVCINAIEHMDARAVDVLIALDNPRVKFDCGKHGMARTRMFVLERSFPGIHEDELRGMTMALIGAGLVRWIDVYENPQLTRTDEKGFHLDNLARNNMVCSPCTTPAGERLARLFSDKQDENRGVRYSDGQQAIPIG